MTKMVKENKNRKFVVGARKVLVIWATWTVPVARVVLAVPVARVEAIREVRAVTLAVRKEELSAVVVIRKKATKVAVVRSGS